MFAVQRHVHDPAFEGGYPYRLDLAARSWGTGRRWGSEQIADSVSQAMRTVTVCVGWS
jgi:hypothetical protein